MMNLKLPPQEFNTSPHFPGYHLKITQSQWAVSEPASSQSSSAFTEINADSSTEAFTETNLVRFSLRIQDLAASKVKGSFCH